MVAEEKRVMIWTEVGTGGEGFDGDWLAQVLLHPEDAFGDAVVFEGCDREDGVKAVGEECEE